MKPRTHRLLGSLSRHRETNRHVGGMSRSETALSHRIGRKQEGHKKYRLHVRKHNKLIK